MHSVCVKSDRNSWERSSKRELEKKFKPWLIFHFHTPCQSGHKVGANTRLSVLESYVKNGRTTLWCWKGRWKGFPNLLNHPTSTSEEARCSYSLRNHKSDYNSSWGCQDIWTKFHGSSSSNCQDISLKATNVNLIEEKSGNQQIQWDTSSWNHECVYDIHSYQSIW